MAQDGKKAAVALGAVALIGGGIYLLSRKAEAAPPAPEPGLASLYGKVTDAETGRPISGVLVTLDGMETSTNGQGRYTFNNLEPGAYTVTFEKEGYETQVY